MADSAASASSIRTWSRLRTSYCRAKDAQSFALSSPFLGIGHGQSQPVPAAMTSISGGTARNAEAARPRLRYSSGSGGLGKMPRNFGRSNDLSSWRPATGRDRGPISPLENLGSPPLSFVQKARIALRASHPAPVTCCTNTAGGNFHGCTTLAGKNLPTIGNSPPV